MFWLILGLLAAAVAAHYLYEKQRSSSRIKITNQAVFITGCDTGFGNMTTKALDALNVRVFAGCLTQAGADSLTKECSKRVTPILCDVTKDDDITKAASFVMKACESEGLTFWGVVNNAGIVWGFSVDFSSVDTYRRTLAVNFFGTVATTKAFLQPVKRNQGRVVNVASVAGHVAGPGMSGYAASKFAVEAFSDSLRREMIPWGVNVSIIEPAFMKTPLVMVLAEKNFEKMVAETPQEIKDQYGPAWIGQVRQRWDKISSTAGDPQEVVDAIVDALLTTSPKTRYMMPKTAFVLYFLSRMPAFVLDHVTQWIGPPAPAAVLARKQK